MSEKQEYKQFRELLARTVSGYKTQKQFAEKAGLSNEHINRMLKNETISQPTKQTLTKILMASDSSISAKELFESCGYEEQDYRAAVKQMRNRLPEPQHENLVADDIITTGKQLIRQASVYPDLKAIVTAFVHNSPEISAVKVVKLQEHATNHGETAIVCGGKYTIQIDESSYYENIIPFVLYAIPAINGQYILTHIAIDGETMLRYNLLSPKDIRILVEQGTNPRELAYIQHQKKKQRDPDSAESRLLRAIFGEEDPNAVVFYDMVYGYGTICDHMPAKFKPYILANRDLFVSDDIESELVSCLENIPDEDQADMERLFSDYGYGPSGYQSAILKILNAKYQAKNLPGKIEYQKSDDYVDPSGRLVRLKPVIHVPEDYMVRYGKIKPEIRENIQSFMNEELKTLGFETAGTTLAYTTMPVSLKDIREYQKQL